MLRPWSQLQRYAALWTCSGVFFAAITLTSTTIAAERRTLEVATSAELYRAVGEANRRGFIEILLADGEYALRRTLVISGDDVALRSKSGERVRVVLSGNGMRPTDHVDNLVVVSGRNVSLVGLTLQQAGNHLVQLRGESDADHFRLVNCVLRDGYEQLFKASAKSDGELSADFGVVRDSLFEYSADFGPNYYIGGIDIHGGRQWQVEGNTFRNIASPSGREAEHAVHFWSRSADNVVRDNLIINSDRGIGFGLSDDWARHNRGGEISGNVILHMRRDHPFADVGIALENSPETRVTGNFIYFAHDYPRAIEYRFTGTTGVVISGNTTNKAIAARDGGEAVVRDNHTASTIATGLDYLRSSVNRLRSGTQE